MPRDLVEQFFFDGFSFEQKETAMVLLNECTDEELYQLFEEVFPLVAKKLMKIRRSRLTKYSNKQIEL